MEFIPKGVCSRKMSFDIVDGRIHNLVVTGGCNGNSKGLSALVEGMEIREVILKLDGITCGYRNTSCPGQLAIALKHALEKE